MRSRMVYKKSNSFLSSPDGSKILLVTPSLRGESKRLMRTAGKGITGTSRRLAHRNRAIGNA